MTETTTRSSLTDPAATRLGSSATPAHRFAGSVRACALMGTDPPGGVQRSTNKALTGRAALRGERAAGVGVPERSRRGGLRRSLRVAGTPPVASTGTATTDARADAYRRAASRLDASERPASASRSGAAGEGCDEVCESPGPPRGEHRDGDDGRARRCSRVRALAREHAPNASRENVRTTANEHIPESENVVPLRREVLAPDEERVRRLGEEALDVIAR